MAIAFARVSIHTRSKGHSAIAASAYRSGLKLYDSRTGLTHDYSKRKEVVFSEIILPKDSNLSFLDREKLWNAAETSEHRKDAQICKDFVLALPRELDLTEQVQLSKRFIEKYFTENKIPVDLSIHDDKDGNPHAHILVPTRRLERHGFSKFKARDLNPSFAKGFVVENDYWGERWREIQNDYFIEKKIDVRVELNHLMSERHRGRINKLIPHYLAEENKLITESRVELALNSTNKIIEHLYKKCSVFNRRDIERLLFKTFRQGNNSYDYLSKVEEVLAHKNIIEIGKDNGGSALYTTKQQYIEEQLLQRNLTRLINRENHKIDINNLNLTSIALSEEQKAAFDFVLKGSDINVIVGRAGTGKSYLMKPISDAYKKQKYRVIGAALSGKVAKALQDDTGIASSTVASLLYRLDNKIMQLSNKDIVIIDEAGMVDCKSMCKLIKAVTKAGSKIVLVGDPDQLRPINKGEIFRGISAKTGYIELDNIRRQEDSADRKASFDLSKGKIHEALNHYNSKRAIHFAQSMELATSEVIKDWQEQITKDNLKASTILSFTKKSVADLNYQARIALKKLKLIGKMEINYKTNEREIQISEGERLLFKQNNKILGVKNGDIGTVLSFNKESMHIKLDSGEVKTIPCDYKAIDYGYALTVHKSQGMTTEKNYVLVDTAYWDKNLSYVALTRHKKTLNIYVDKAQHPTLEDLQKTMSKTVVRTNVMDWSTNSHTGLTWGILTKLRGFLKMNTKPQHYLENEKIRKYCEMQKQIKAKTGYFAEKYYKEMHLLAKEILADRAIRKAISVHNPNLMKEVLQASKGRDELEKIR